MEDRAEQWDLVIKVKHGYILRRIGAHVNGKLMDPNTNKLRAKIYSLFKFSYDTDLILTYADVDGDIVALDDDDELFDAVIGQRLNPLRITVELKSKPGTSTSFSPALSKAARDTGAEVMNKLEKEVEELSWRLLQLEKSMRADMEEAKSRENVELKVELQNMQQEITEIKALLIKEKEISEKVIEEARMLKEVPLFYTELKDKLTAEINKLKELVSSLEKKVDETEKKVEATSRIRMEMLNQLSNSMKRLLDKISNSKAENQVLCQSSLLSSPMMSEDLSNPMVPTTLTLQKGQHDSEEPKVMPESMDALISCIVEDLGFSDGKPVAAYTIYKCLLHWKSFEADRSDVFDCLIHVIGSTIGSGKNNEHMAYWLSNTSVLLILLQKGLKDSNYEAVPCQKRTHNSLLDRTRQDFHTSASRDFDEPSSVHQVEAKYSSLIFKEQLTAYVKKMYETIRDNVKMEITSLISLCTQAPKTGSVCILGGNSRSSGNSSQSNHWLSMIECLDKHLKTLQENHVPQIFIQSCFNQNFEFINVQLFNSLLLQRECCRFTNGEYVKYGLAELEIWCAKANQYAGSAWDELVHTRQAVGFLITLQKHGLSYDKIANELCPALSVQQLYRICCMYRDDKYNTQNVSCNVVYYMRTLNEEDLSTFVSSTFLLDDYSSIPFSMDDISTALLQD